MKYQSQVTDFRRSKYIFHERIVKYGWLQLS